GAEAARSPGTGCRGSTTPGSRSTRRGGPWCGARRIRGRRGPRSAPGGARGRAGGSSGLLPLAAQLLGLGADRLGPGVDFGGLAAVLGGAVPVLAGRLPVAAGPLQALHRHEVAAADLAGGVDGERQ